MPRLLKSTANACALLCAAMLAQTFDTPPVRRAAAADTETQRRAAPTTRVRADADAHTAAAAFGNLPLNFEVNRGQADSRVEYLARGAGYTLGLTRAGALLSLKPRVGEAAKGGGVTRAATLRLSFPGANPAARPAGRGLAETKSNYLKGRNPADWLTGVENYGRVVYERLYEGVDLVFYGSGGRLEYDFRLAAGADAGRVRVRFDGVERARLDAEGALVLRTRAGEVRQPRPIAYQTEGGAKTFVACDYVLNGSGEVGFRLGAYDRARSLVIDPVLVYSTLLGGSSGDGANALAVDAAGNVYVTGSTDSLDFPTSADARQKTYAGPAPSTPPFTGDVFVSKLNPAGTALVYSTYVGGAGGDSGLGLALDAAGNAFVAGATYSADFPTSADAFDKTCGNAGTCDDLSSSPGPELDGFVFKLNQNGSALVYSTYFPGAAAVALALGSDGSAYITGATTTTDSNPPTLPVVNAYQPTLGGAFTLDAFAAKLNPAGSAVLFSTFLGGREGPGDTPRGGDDSGLDIGLDSAGNVYVVGTTRSGCFPSGNPYVVPASCPFGGAQREFLVKFSPAGDTLLFSKRVGTLPSTGGELSVTAAGVSTVADTCLSPAGHFDVCVDRVSTTGQTTFTTTFGGSASESLVGGVAYDDSSRNVYVAGRTNSPDYPTTAGALKSSLTGPTDGFVTRLSTDFAEIQLDAAVYDVSEGAGKVTVRVNRSGEMIGPSEVAYTTGGGTASSLADYRAVSGTLLFGEGEAFKLVDVFITDDAFGPEGVETFDFTLHSPSGGAVITPPASATVRINDNDAAPGPNPIEPPGFNPDFFVRQHYVDFLNREPDADGFAFWKGQLGGCGSDAACLEVKRINVSAAFFLSIEFQETSYFVYRVYKTAYGDATSPGVAGTVPVIRYAEYLPGAQKVGGGVIVGPGPWQQQLDANKRAFALDVVQTERFVNAFPFSMTTEQFVDKLDQNAGGVLSASEREQIVAEMNAGGATSAERAVALRRVADDADLKRNELRRAFVLMQYYGYLRRDPDAPPEPNLNFAGWKFWLDKLNQFDGDFVRAEMIKAFLSSDEYRHRFGP
jgi:Calx-beta domain/Beta-propeller repeat/Domain of unknown function (DUF4214)